MHLAVRRLIFAFVFQTFAVLCRGVEYHSLDVEYLPGSARVASSLHLQNSKIGRLQKTTPLLWPKLEDVYFKSVEMQQQPWAELKGAIHLNSLHLNDFSVTGVGSIGEPFEKNISPTLKFLTLEKLKVKRLEQNSLGRVMNLVLLNIADVPLSELPRNVLPTRMPELHTFILGSTLIRTIENNFFDNMPKLVNVLLVNNRITTLPAELFSPTKHISLIQLLVKNNPLECNCNILWLQKAYRSQSSTNVYVTCHDKIQQKYKEAMFLRQNDYCY